MTKTPVEATNAMTAISDGVEALLARLRALDDEAATIRATLKTLRKRIAGGGPRAGAKARTGRKRKTPDLLALPDETAGFAQ